MSSPKSKSSIIICYDISNTKLRNKFSKFLEIYGVRLQLSVFELEHSARLLRVIEQKIKQNFEPQFEEGDSVFIFYTDLDKAIRYGSSKHINTGFIFIDLNKNSEGEGGGGGKNLR